MLICVILHVRHEKLPFHADLTWVLILGKIQDGDHSWWRHRPPAAPPPINYTASYWEDHRLSTEGKIVSKYYNISKTLGRGSIKPPLVPRWGYEFACTTEGYCIIFWTIAMNFNTCEVSSQGWLSSNCKVALSAWISANRSSQKLAVNWVRVENVFGETLFTFSLINILSQFSLVSFL